MIDLGNDKTIAGIAARLKDRSSKGEVISLAGNWGSFGRLLAAHVFRQAERPVLYVCPHIDDADKACDDLRTFGVSQVDIFAAWEGAEELADATDETRAQRLALVLKLIAKPKNPFVVTSIQALCQPVAKPDVLDAGSLELSTGAEIAPEKVISWLVDNGFERVEKIDLPGQFAARGGIVDIYAPVVRGSEFIDEQAVVLGDSGEALRVEFFGDEIESIRQIDLDTQRSSGNLSSVGVVSASAGTGEAEQRQQFLELLSDDAIVICEEPGDIADVANIYVQRLDAPESVYEYRQITEAMKRFSQLHLGRFAASADDIKIDVKSIQQFQHTGPNAWTGHKQGLEDLVKAAGRGTDVYVYCDTTAEIKRVEQIIKQNHTSSPKKLNLLPGFIDRGFSFDSLNAIVISHHELFGQYALRRRQRPVRAAMPIDVLSDLQAGDLVVHASYGIGKFVGIKTLTDQGRTSEYLTLQYADDVKVQVSTANIALVQKYIGSSPKRPRLSKIGSKKWQNQKQKVAQSVKDLAAELLRVQAEREFVGGTAFSADTQWQVEFEGAFAYKETADQLTAAGDIKGDMKKNVAMDRLLCGDVGYGKTELAMRAAFKAVESGKQVAMLVPTTVLCVQHARTFAERFADFPVTIDSLNRFKTPRLARKTIGQMQTGQLDIVIGTHRLLSSDVGFKDLGLLIIDEEQRFGVEAKEKLKKLRVNVDVLTMTATPIPRTLHMSLLGLRDISSLQTPPLDRRSVVTKVTASNPDLIYKAIVHELNRQGQVFFLHNRVRTIEKKAWEIKRLLSDKNVEAKVAIAHGQMPKSQLEEVMVDFVTGKIDILVCTTIIESGLDIPNANTIFIDNADRFGLAELHQLRGRVGRYKHRAYAYMLTPSNRPITPIATKRLKAIEEYSHLGAGFRIALRDLEIRGAGNILGSEQSGHIQIVGYQMYCDLLTAAVRKLRNEPVPSTPSANLDLGFSSYIPKSYISSDRQRMEVYRRFAVARSLDDLEQLKGELDDVYGKCCEEVTLLGDLAELRIRASKYGIKSIVVSNVDLIFAFEDNANKAVDLFARVSGTVRIGDPRTVYLRLNKNYFEPPTLIRVLRKILK